MEFNPFIPFVSEVLTFQGKLKTERDETRKFN